MHLSVFAVCGEDHHEPAQGGRDACGSCLVRRADVDACLEGAGQAFQRRGIGDAGRGLHGAGAGVKSEREETERTE